MKYIFSMGNDVTFWHPQFWNESFNKKAKQFFPAKGFCSFVFNSVTLSSSGKISKCCMDLRGATQYADFTKDTLENIWHSQVRKESLRLMFSNKRSMLKGCSTCTIKHTENDNRYNNLARAFRRKVSLLIYGRDYYLKPSK